MNSAVLSRQEATAVARSFADMVVADHGEVVAVALVGSLGTNDYVPGRSDIDTVIVFAAGTDPTVTADIERIASEYQREYEVPKGFGAVCVRLDQLRSPYDPDEELAPEVLDLKQRGRIIAGQLDLASIPSPTEADLRAYCRMFVPWLRSERRRANRPAANQTPDANINGLMYELRAAVLARTGRYVLNKRDVIPALLADDPPPFAADLWRVHEYLLCQRPAPANPWIDRLRDEAEDYVTEVAPWLVGSSGIG